jgi:poly(A) polymerase Pap1
VFGGADKDSDIDLLITSYHELMSREVFLNDFVAFLKTFCSNVQTISNAKVPIVKLEYLGTNIDILYCAMISPASGLAPPPDYLLQLKNARYEKVNSLSYMGWKTC